MAAVNDLAPRAAAAVIIERILDTLAASRLKSAVAILIVALAFFLPGFNTLPPIDREDTLAALSARQMVETGNLADGHLDVERRFAGPVAAYWLGAAATWITGHGPGDTPPIWVYRLPSLLAAIAAALLTWWTGLALARPRAALLAGLLFPASLVIGGVARLAGPDACLLAVIVLGEGALARLWLRSGDSSGLLLPFLFWTALGLGILMGGLVAPLVFGLTLLVLTFEEGRLDWMRRLAPLPGLIWLAVLLTPGLLAMLAAGAGGGGSGAPPAVPVQGNVAAPPGTYLLTFLFLFWPSGAFAALAVPYVLDNSRRRPVMLLLAWAVPFWLLLELWPEKLPQYIVPIWPAVAILGAMAVDADALRTGGRRAWIVKASLFVVPLAVGVYSGLGYIEDNGTLAPAIVLFYGLSLVAAAAAWLWLERSASGLAAAVPGLLAGLFFVLGFFGTVLPGFERLRIAERAVAAGRAALSCPDPKLASIGLREPSVLLAGGAALQLASASAGAEFLAKGGCRAVLLDRRRQASFAQRAEDLGLEVEVRATIKGYNLGILKSAVIHVVVQKGAAE